MAVNRRARRRPARWLLAGALLTLVVLLVDAALSAHPSASENLLAYFAQIRQPIQSSADEGADMAAVRANAVKLGRDGIVRRLERLTVQTKKTLEVTTAVVPPPTLRVSHAYLVAALGVRVKAANDARVAMTSALSEGPPDPGIQGMTSAGNLMQLSDQSYDLFAGSLPAHTATPPPPAKWISDPSIWTSQEVGIYVTSLRSSMSLSGVHDLAVVTFSTEPSPVGEDKAALIIPPTRGMQVSIVVANVGNLAEHHATVTAKLVTDVRGTTETVRDFVDLAAGQRSALTIGSLHPASGTTGTLTVDISVVGGETNVANNSMQQSLAMR